MTGGYDDARTLMGLPISQLVLRTAEAARISTPFANHDNNRHSFNENPRVRNLWDGIELMAALMAM